jgi:ribosomal protein S18 acetylase RimI-like enzyme
VSSPFRLEPLGEYHDRNTFTCGQEALDRYLRTQVTQDIRRRIAACFVAIEQSSDRVAAFYTVAAASIPIVDLPAEVTRKLPKYPTLPAVRIGRLAVDLDFRGKGLGAGLVADALRRILAAPAAAFGIVVKAKDEYTVAFYRHHGFQPLIGQVRTLFVSTATAEKTLPT